MTIAEFDHLPGEKKKELLQRCCGSSTWVNKMLTVFPVEDLVELLDASEEKWDECTIADWEEAFEHHPRIGDVNSLEEKFPDTAEWAAGEQAAVKMAKENTLQELAKANVDYQQKFGFIYIICATGRSAENMLANIKIRLNNNKEEELNTAAGEQLKITKLRLKKLFGVNEHLSKHEI